MSIHLNEITVLFDGTVALGGCKRKGVTSNGQEIETVNLTIQSMMKKQERGTPVEKENLIGPEIFLAFKTPESIEQMISHLQKLKDKMNETPT